MRIPFSPVLREIGLVVLVAIGFLVGLSLVGWATAPLVPPEPTPESRAVAVEHASGEPDPAPPAGRAIPDGSSDAADPDGPAGREAAPAEATTTDLPADSAGRLRALLRERYLTLPVEGVDRDALYDSFDDPRSGDRTHRAIDIMAPRGTPVFAVEDGTIAKLDDSQGGGGIVIYQYDPDRHFVYYYAHLEKWVDGLEEGDRVGRGQVIGYVGSTGNAPEDAPHLHFSITLLDANDRWWDGVPINPFGLF